MIKLSKSLYALLLGLIFTMIFFGSAIYYAYVTEEGILGDFDTVEETHQVLNDLGKVNHLLSNLEIESKAYESTNKKEFLDLFENDVNAILKTIKRIHTELEYDSVQAAKCLLLQDLVQTKLSIVKDDFIPSTHNENTHELLKDRLHLEINTKLKMMQILDELTKLQEINLQEEQETVLDKLKRTHFVIGIIGIFSLALTIF